MIVANISPLRDPCVLLANGIYYMYGTGWQGYRNSSGSLDGTWEPLGMVVEVPKDCAGNQWAPEVHAINGAYYMLTTYLSKTSGHRGCAVFRASTPQGPFKQISNNHVTPSDWDSIDATLYVDPTSQPWMIFVHEWTSTDDGIGRMAAAKLSHDLTHLISEPIELFRADDAPWANRQVTDGCFLHQTEDNQLLMIWSNFSDDGYRIGIARSRSGRVDGEWTQDKEPLYAKSMGFPYDGGHGMLFKDSDKALMLAMHAPNARIGDRAETPVFLKIREDCGTLKLDLSMKTDEFLH